MIIIITDNKYFDQISKALHYSLKELKVKCSISSKINYEDNNCYILFIVNSLEKFPKKYIVYNFEQLITNRMWDKSFYKKLQNALYVWDYSLENVNHLKKYEIEAIHVPLGYCPSFEFEKNKNRNIDILFLGTMNNYRLLNLLDITLKTKLKNEFAKLICEENCFGKKYEDYIGRSKIGLNMHFYNGPTILEVTRIIPMVINGCLVISEKSNDEYYDKMLKDIVIFSKIENFYKVCHKYLNDEGKMKKQIEKSLEKIKKNSYIDHIKNTKIIEILKRIELFNKFIL